MVAIRFLAATFGLSGLRLAATLRVLIFLRSEAAGASTVFSTCAALAVAGLALAIRANAAGAAALGAFAILAAATVSHRRSGGSGKRR